MPFDRPSPTEILQRIQAEIDIAIPGADARLRRSVESVIARVLAMAAHEMFGYLDWNSRQILPDSAEAEYLARHAALWGIERKAATAAGGSITFSGTDGSVIPAGSVLRRSDTLEYALAADVTIAAGTGTGTVSASSAGADGNADIGTKLSLVSPVAGVETSVSVIDDGSGGGLTGGTDTETDSALRVRVIERIQEPPQGGADFDYVSWAKEVAGVTRAWVYPLQLGLGTVEVIFVMDNKVGTIVPSASEVEAVQDHIDAVRPVTADVTVAAPTPVEVDFEIHVSPNSVAIQTAIKAELEDFFKREAVPGGTLWLSRINEAISAATGEFDHILVSPAANVEMDFGELPVVGDYTWEAL